MKKVSEIVPGDIVFIPGFPGDDEEPSQHLKVLRIEPVTYYRVLLEGGSTSMNLSADPSMIVATRTETHVCGCVWVVYPPEDRVNPEAVVETEERGAEGYFKIEDCVTHSEVDAERV